MLRRLSRGGEPVDVVDEAIVHLDSPSEPWSVHLEVHLRGPIDELRLRRAVEVALDRHPRARARLVSGSRRPQGYEWHTAGLDLDPFDVVHCQDDRALAAAREELLSRPVPLDASPPLRIRLLHHPAGDVVVLNLHHAAGDGMAALVLLQSVARTYAGRPEAVAAPPEEPTLVRLPSNRLRVVAAELQEAFRPSARIAADGGRDAPGYALQLVRLDAAHTRALRAHAREGTTVNDLLLAALHLAVARWNAEHGRPPGRVSVLMPVNLRSPQRWREGFGNHTFMVPVATLPRQRTSMAATVDAVRRRTRSIKKRRAATTVATCLQRLQRLPLAARRWIARQAGSERLMPTTLLSNLGMIEHDLDFGPGVGTPSHVWFSPPAKLPLGLAVGALTSDGELHVAFRVRHPLFGRQALARFADCYASALRSLIEVEPVAVPASQSSTRAA
jgi:NRPS condensation-like uncharacterized protein